MAQNRGYEDLSVWEKSIDLSIAVYALTRDFPKHEQYGLASQMQRSAVSVASNIAEGCARNSYGEFIQFLGIATGSIAELHTQLIIANRLNYLNEEKFHGLNMQIGQIRKMLNALKRSLKDAVPKLVTRNS